MTGEKLISELSKFDMKCDLVPDGYDLTSVPALTRENLGMVIGKINELIQAHNDRVSSHEGAQPR